MSAPQDPNRIDVSLNIMSDATLQAVNKLTNQLSSLREFLAAQGMDPASQAQSAGSWSAQQAGGYAYTHPGTTQAGIFHGPSQPIIQNQPSNPSTSAGASRERSRALQQEYREYMESVHGGGVPTPLSPQAEQMMAHQISDVQRFSLAGAEKRNPNLPNITSRMDRFFSLYPGVSRDPFEDRSYEFEGGTPRRGGSALPEGMGTGGGSYPPQGPPTTSPMGEGGDMPGWWQALNREGISPEARLGLTIPRLGEFTIQDKLNMAAQWMGRAAMRRPDAEDPGRRTAIMGRTAAGAAYLRDQSAAIVAVGREFQRLRNFARGEEQSTEQLGFSRESALGDVELFGIGGRLNLGLTSAAQREAFRQEITQRRVQAAAGVSGEEASRIRNVVAGMGYSGNVNERLQLDLFRHLQQRGIAPEAAAPLVDQGIRQGNMSIAALRDTIVDLADAARNAHQTLEEATSSALEYSESVQQIGANYEASLRNAATFTRVGLDPRIAGQAMQSPMVQGFLSMQTGLPPQLQGVIGAPGVMQGMSQAIQAGLDLGAPFAQLPDTTITSASGQKITTSTGHDAQIAMAQQMTGIPRQIIERYMRNPNFLRAGGVAQTMVGQMQDQVRAMTNRERQVRVSDARSGGRLGSYHPGAPDAGSHLETQGYTVGLTGRQRQALEHGSTSDQVVQYDELEQQMIAMDPTNKDWAARVRKIRKDHGDIGDRLRTAQRIIGESVDTAPQPDYLVGLTDEARKILRIERPKDRTGAVPRANAGGAPANAAMQGPNYPGSSGSAMMYGNPGGP
jgi:hypothetical protein